MIELVKTGQNQYEKGTTRSQLPSSSNSLMKEAHKMKSQAKKKADKPKEKGQLIIPSLQPTKASGSMHSFQKTMVQLMPEDRAQNTSLLVEHQPAAFKAAPTTSSLVHAKHSADIINHRSFKTEAASASHRRSADNLHQPGSRRSIHVERRDSTSSFNSLRLIPSVHSPAG